MFRPLRLSPALAAALLGGAGLFAEEAAPSGDSAKQAAAPAKKETASPAVSAMISARLPKYDPAKSAEKPSPVPAEAADEPVKSRAQIVRLPSMIVRQPRLPGRSEVLTKEEKTRRGMDEYIGPEDGIDRGFLNLFTLAGLWKRVPVLGHVRIMDFETNEDRGLRLYQEAEMRQQWEDVARLSAIGQKADAALEREKKPEGK